MLSSFVPHRSARLLTVLAWLAVGSCNADSKGDQSLDRARSQALTGATLLTVDMNGYLGLLDSEVFRVAGNVNQVKSFDLRAGTFSLFAQNTADLSGNPAGAGSADAPPAPAGTYTIASGGAVSLDATAMISFTVQQTGPQAATIKVKTVPLTFDRSGNTGPDIGLFATDASPFSRGTVRLMADRRYRFTSDGSIRLGTADHSFADMVDLTVSSNGTAAITDANTQKSISASGSTVKLLVAPVVFDGKGYSGSELTLNGQTSLLPSATMQMVKNRRYKLVSRDSTDPTSGSTDFSTGYDVAVDAGGAVTLGSESSRSFSVSGSTVSARIGFVQILRNGYTGSLCLQHVACAPAESPLQAALIVARNFGVGTTVQGSGGSPVRVNADGTCNVAAVTLGGISLTVKCGSTAPGPAAPTGLTGAQSGSHRVDLSWSDVATDETNYQVLRSTDAGGFKVLADRLPANTKFFSDDSAAENVTNSYQVRAYNLTGFSLASNTVAVMVNPVPTCGGAGPACPDPALSQFNHNAPRIDYRHESPTLMRLAEAPGPRGLVTDATNGEALVMPATQSCVGSRVDDLRWSFSQESVDFTTGSDGPDSPGRGCRGLATLAKKLPSLQLVRYHRPRLEHMVSSFGPGVFSNFDARMTFHAVGVDGHPNAVLFNPETDAPAVTFFDRSVVEGDDVDDGHMHDTETRTYGDLDLYALVGTAWQPVASVAQATRIVVSRRDGGGLYFEPIATNPGDPGQIEGRPTGVFDANGNMFEIGYQFPRDASDQTLGFDRSQLWKIAFVRDSLHGHRVDFAYQRRPATGRWLVSTVTALLSDGTARVHSYSYSDTGSADTLVQVKYPDGSTSSFARAFDAASQLWGLSYDDVGAGPRNLRKTVWVTGPTFMTPDGKVHGQTPNLVRKVVNGDQEEVLRLQEDPSDPNTTFVIESGRTLSRMATNGRGAPIEVARARAMSSDPLTATFDTLESYISDDRGKLTQVNDAFGGTRAFERDFFGQPIAFTARDGTSAHWVMHWTGQPTHQVDRAGGVVDTLYDDGGNILKVTQAPGTPAQAVTTFARVAPSGQVASRTDPLGRVTDYTYASGYLASVTDPPDAPGGARPVTRFETGAFGLLAAKTLPSGKRITYQYDARNRLISTTFPDGTRESITYGTGVLAALPVTETDRRGVTTTYEYDGTRRLKKIVRAANKPEKLEELFEYVPGTELISATTVAGDRTEFVYDQRNREITRRRFATNTGVLTWQRSYDLADRLATETDPYGRKTFHVYDANGREVRLVRELIPGGVPAGANLTTLVRITTGNPPYVITDKELDPMGRVLSSTNERGFRTTSKYDSLGRQVELVEADGTPGARVTRFEYDLAGNRTRTVLPRAFREGGQFQTLYSYTGRDLQASRTEAAGTTEAATTGYTYDPDALPSTITDPRGGVSASAYDTSNRLQSTKDVAGFTTAFAYDAAGNRTSVTNPLGQATTYTFDGHNRVLTERNAAGEVTTYQYDDNLTDGVGLDLTYQTQLAGLGFGAKATGHATLVTNPAGEAELTVEDGLRRRILSIDGTGGITRTSYDTVVAGLVEVAITNPLGSVTRQRRDALDRPRIAIDALGKQSTSSLDPGGNVVSSRDPLGNGEDCTFDELDRRKTCTDSQGDSTTFESDAAGNPIATVDGTGARATCAFDALNRKVSCTDRNGATSRWAYDKAGNVTSITDAQNGVTSYTYDARNLQTTVTFPDSSSSTDKQTFTYDAAGRRTSKTLQNGNVIGYTYDAAGRLTQRSYPDGKNDTFAYDLASRPKTAASARYGTSVAVTYDKAGRTTKETLTFQGKTYSVSGAYDTAGRLTKLTYPDATVVNRGFSARDQLTSLSLGTSAGTKSVATLGYDDAGQATSITLGNGLVETRSYRPDHTLASSSTGTVGNFTYTYDKAKRKLSEGGSASPSGPQSFAYDPEGRLTSWSSAAASQSWLLSLVGDWVSTTRGSSTETRTHNAAHELTKVGSASLSYTSRGDIQGDDLGNTLAIDPESRVQSFTKSGGSAIPFFYDAFGRKVGKTVGSNTTVFVNFGANTVAEYLNGTFNLSYVLGAGVDDYLALYKGGKLSWFTRNHLGTVNAVTDEAKAIKERYRYTAYGDRTILSPTGSVLTSSAVGNQIGFTGRYHDKDTGLVDYRFRQYNPRLGRFTSRDDGYRDGLNLYAAAHVPNATDPTGHETFLAGPPLRMTSAGSTLGTGGADPRRPAIWRSACSAPTQAYQTGTYTPPTPTLGADGNTTAPGGGSGGTTAACDSQKKKCCPPGWDSYGDKNGYCPCDKANYHGEWTCEQAGGAGSLGGGGSGPRGGGGGGGVGAGGGVRTWDVNVDGPDHSNDTHPPSDDPCRYEASAAFTDDPALRTQQKCQRLLKCRVDRCEDDFPGDESHAKDECYDYANRENQRCRDDLQEDPGLTGLRGGKWTSRNTRTLVQNSLAAAGAGYLLWIAAITALGGI
jgi:RHS repeat-associated protein